MPLVVAGASKII